MPSNQKQVIEQTKFTYSPLVKAFEKEATIEEQTKIIKDKENEQVKATKSNEDVGENNKLYEDKFLMSFLMKESVKYMI